MKRFWFYALLPILVASVTCTGQTVATAAPAAETAAAGGGFAQLRADAMAQLLAGEFQTGSAGLKAALARAPEDAASVKADQWVSEYLTRRAADEVDRKRDFDAAVAMAKSLLAIAEHAADDAEDGFGDVREQLGEVRDAIVDLLAAPRVAENVTSDRWYVDRLAADRVKISEVFDAVGEALADDKGRQAERIRTGMAGLLAALDAFAAEAATATWDTHEVAERSSDELTDQTEALAMATDDLTTLVSERPWRAAAERLRIAQRIAGEDTAFRAEPWAQAIVAGSIARAETYEQDRKWYDALGLYNTLKDLDDDNNRYDAEIKRVMRHARVMSLYDLGDDAEQVASADLGEAESPDPAEGAADDAEVAAMVDKPAEWREYVRGVDALMVGRALTSINETYVETIDYRKALLGALRAVGVLAQSPELAGTFDGLTDEKANDEFVARIESLTEEASKIDDMTYRHVRRTLNQILWANRQTVQIPDEVVQVEFTDGFMKELDRFSSMIWPSEWPEFMKHTMGSFKGVGIQIQVQPDSKLLMVVSPLENSPAYRAEIKAGDFIMEIDGADAKGIDIEEAVKRITGPEGTKVVLTVKRPGLDALLSKTLVREEIHIQTVKGWMRTNGDAWDWFIDPDNRIGYVRMTSFNRDTAKELREALTAMESQGARGLILDLRGNPGGLLGAAVSVVDEFVSEGTIVSTKGRQQRPGRLYANEAGSFLDGELIVLIDDRSASAAEIVSGALKDLGRAVIVGQRSFGKGSVQNLIPIQQGPSGANDAFLKVTTAYYYLPSERCLHRTEGATVWGVEPDVKPVASPRQIRRWLTLLRRTEIIKTRDAEQLREDMARQFRADIQLDAALLVCRLRLLQDDLDATAAQTQQVANESEAQ